MNARTVAVLVLVLVAGSASLALAQSAVGPAGKPPVLREIGITQRIGADLPLEAELRDEAGRPVKLADLFPGASAGGRPAVLALVYFRCPMLCNEVLNGLTGALKTMSLDAGRDFDVLAVSFDPRDTPEVAAAKRDAYVRRYGREGARNGWRFLTGDEAAIRAITTAIGFRYAYDAKTGEFAHASAVYVITPGGKIARYFYGAEYAPRDLRLGIVEASAGKVGTLADEVMLYCYRYDPMTGKYGPIAMNMVRGGAIATVLAIVGFWVYAWRRGRRARPCPA